ncbi:MAG: ABC transporter permease subunit [Candidatus Odinarchaeota archaeon]
MIRLELSITVARKELREIVLRSKLILSMILAVPVVLGFLMPTILAWISLPMIGETIPGYVIPPLTPNWDLIPSGGQFYIFFINLYGGLLNLVQPLMIPVYIAADSFAGEKERKTLEPVLAAPITDFELLLGKTLTSLIPALAASCLSTSLSIISLNIIGFPVFGFIIYPVVPIMILYIIGIPLMSLLTVFAMVIVSSKVQRVREASQVGGVVIIPILILFFTQIFGAVPLSLLVIAIYLVVVACIVIVLIFVSVRVFNRQRLIEMI